MLNSQGFSVPRTLDEMVSRANTALLVYDMQAGIVGQVKGGAEVAGRVQQILNAARRIGLRTFFTRHMSLPRNLMGAFQLRTAMAWQRVDDPEKVKSIFVRNSPAFEIVPELEPLESEAVFDKITMSAFESTPLEIALRDCGIRSFIVAGIALEIGIDPTCRHAADLGLIPILVKDACGFGNAEAAAHSLASLAHMGDAIITDTNVVCDLLAKFPAAALNR